MSNRIIFIGGIHGVGKGTFCNKLKIEYSIPHFSASELLKWFEISSKENKLVENFSSTQERLIAGINDKIKEGSLTILDGHFCLLNNRGIPECIDESTFIDINPIAIGIVIENVTVVKQRLDGRDKVNYQFSTLRKMQEMEIEQGKKVSKYLGVPFFEIFNGKYNNLSNFIKSIK